jgi:predicted ATPase
MWPTPIRPLYGLTSARGRPPWRAIPELRAVMTDGELAALPGGDQSRFPFFDAFAIFLATAATRRPLVLLLEDVHWLDTPSSLLLQFLAQELERAPLLLLATYRDDGLGRHHPLMHALGDLVRQPGTQSVRLGGLSEGDVERFIERATGQPPDITLVRAVAARTGGNPFFLTEITRLLVEQTGPGCSPELPPSVPHGVRAAIGRRVQTLSGGCQQALVLAAALGREFTAAVLEAVGEESGLGPTGERLLEALDEAAAARIISVVPRGVGRYAFTHALIREALYEELHPAGRARLHRRIAEVLERVSGARPDVSRCTDGGSALVELAYHVRQGAQDAGDLERAIAYASAAGDCAMEVLAWEDAARHYERALEAQALTPPDERRHAEVLLRLGRAHTKSGDVARATDAFERAAALARRLRAVTADPEAPALMARAVLGVGGEWWAESMNPKIHASWSAWRRRPSCSGRATAPCAPRS